VLTHEQRTEIYKAIPTEFTIRGIEVPVTIRYANQYRGEEYPCIVLEYTSLTEKSYDFINHVYSITNIMNDILEFKEGVLTYPLSVPRATNIVKVIGVLNGLEYVFVLNDDYYLDGNNIVWTTLPTPGDVPDLNTVFYVVYHSEMIKVTKGGEKIDVLNINVMTKDWGDVKSNNFINGVMLADYIAGQLHKYMQYSLQPPENTVLYVERDIKNLDALTEGEYQRRRLFIVMIKHVEYTSSLVESVKEIETEVSIDEMGN